MVYDFSFFIIKLYIFARNTYLSKCSTQFVRYYKLFHSDGTNSSLIGNA